MKRAKRFYGPQLGSNNRTKWMVK